MCQTVIYKFNIWLLKQHKIWQFMNIEFSYDSCTDIFRKSGIFRGNHWDILIVVIRYYFIRSKISTTNKLVQIKKKSYLQKPTKHIYARYNWLNVGYLTLLLFKQTWGLFPYLPLQENGIRPELYLQIFRRTFILKSTDKFHSPKLRTCANFTNTFSSFIFMREA